jgi:hypothetical protein
LLFIPAGQKLAPIEGDAMNIFGLGLWELLLIAMIGCLPVIFAAIIITLVVYSREPRRPDKG